MQDIHLCCPPILSLAPQWLPTFFILESPLQVTAQVPRQNRRQNVFNSGIQGGLTF